MRLDFRLALRGLLKAPGFSSTTDSIGESGERVRSDGPIV